ncbi:MAG: L-2-amino-thiazoline-4-carboxylic acid hydrolase [Bulleidia sp.]
MSKIFNEPTITDHALCNVRRSAFELRARWASAIYLEAKSRGIDLEEIMRKAIYKIGLENGEEQKKQFTEKIKAHAYGEYFLKRGVPETFEKTVAYENEDEYVVDFHYCPLVKAWQKQGLDDSTIALMCEIAMEGDYGTAEALELDFELQDTIARGGKTCRLRYRSRER